MNISDELAAELLEYFDQRADAEYKTESSSPLPNLEMKLLIALEEAARQAPTSGEPAAYMFSDECGRTKIVLGKETAEHWCPPDETVTSLFAHPPAKVPVYQWREIGETDWMDCSREWKEKCDGSPEHDTRTLYNHPQPAQQGSVPVSLIDAAYHHFCKLKADYPEFSTVRHTERSRFQAAVNQLLVTLATPQPPVEQEGK